MKEITLELRNNNKLEKKWTLERNKKYILGRSDKVDIVIEESTASRKHAQITVLAGGSASIQDLDSANGTFVDGKQVGANQMVILRKDSQIQIGEMKSILVVKEKIVETDDEEEEEEEVVQPKKTKDEKEKTKNKDRRSRSKSPKKSKKNKEEDSRSRSRSNEKEEIGSRKGPAAFEAYKAKPTIKLPNKNKDKAQPQKAQPVTQQTSGGLQDIGLEDEEETHKFMKLMGVKDPKNLNLKDSKHLPGLKYLQKDVKQFTQQTAKMHQDMENQFEKSLMQRGFGKRGLGATYDE